MNHHSRNEDTAVEGDYQRLHQEDDDIDSNELMRRYTDLTPVVTAMMKQGALLTSLPVRDRMGRKVTTVMDVADIHSPSNERACNFFCSVFA
jgi:hypothetical protein